jgi:hypothetical protein
MFCFSGRHQNLVDVNTILRGLSPLDNCWCYDYGFPHLWLPPDPLGHEGDMTVTWQCLPLIWTGWLLFVDEGKQWNGEKEHCTDSGDSYFLHFLMSKLLLQNFNFAGNKDTFVPWGVEICHQRHHVIYLPSSDISYFDQRNQPRIVKSQNNRLTITVVILEYLCVMKACTDSMLVSTIFAFTVKLWLFLTENCFDGTLV